jgi:hypothetical protein
MALVCHTHKYLFVHIFKTGGNSVKVSMPCKGQCETQEVLGVHPTASDFRAAVGYAIWNEYFKFAFIRYPLNWMVSLYHYCRTTESNFLHKEAVKNDLNGWVKFYTSFSKINPANNLEGANKTVSQFEYLSENGKIIVDFIGRQEFMEADMGIIRHKLGIPITPVAKVNVGNYGKPPFGYSAKSLRLMQKHYAMDFELWSNIPKYLHDGKH